MGDIIAQSYAASGGLTSIVDVYRASTLLSLFAFFLSITAICFGFIKLSSAKGSGGAPEPPSLGGSMICNTYQYMTDMQGFLGRVS